MKAKTIIDENEAVDKGLSILNPVPHSNEPRAASEGYDISAMLDGYENEGRKILKASGYPLTVDEITDSRFNEDKMSLRKKPFPRRVRDVMDMFLYFNMVRVSIEKKDISFALCFMGYGVQAAMKARIRPMAPLIEMGKSNVDGGGRGGKISGKVRREKAKSIRGNWQTEAEKIWKKHPAWKNRSVATKVAERIGGNPNTIRKSIQKTLP
ncbi:MAG: hypothetical protein ABII06_15455 [Pseudomonadota bacterium]